MPQAAAIPIITAVVGAAGAASAARSQSKAAEAQFKKTGIPPDLNELRNALAGFFQSGIDSGSLFTGLNNPLTNSISSRLQSATNPRALQANLLGQNPFDVINQLRDQTRPGFEGELKGAFDTFGAQIGAQAGLRPGASSDFNRGFGDILGGASKARENFFAGIFPQVQQGFNQAVGQNNNLLLGAGAFSQANTGLGLNAANQFATSFPSAQPILQPGPGALGGGLQGAAGGLGDLSDYYQTKQLLKMFQQNRPS